jgi:hypothetical protein
MTGAACAHADVTPHAKAIAAAIGKIKVFGFMVLLGVKWVVNFTLITLLYPDTNAAQINTIA